MIQPPTNNVLVSVKTKWIKSFSDIAKTSALENNTSIDPADYVQIVGKVEALPKSISPTSRYKGFSTKDINVGDIVIFSYLVIYNLYQEKDRENIYKNMITFEGKEYFLADITNIFAVIRNEEIIMLNGYVMLTEHEKDKIIIPAHMKKLKATTSSQVLHINHSRTHLKGIDVKQNDCVFYNSKIAQHYEINDKKFIILTQDKILGKKVSK